MPRRKATSTGHVDELDPKPARIPIHPDKLERLRTYPHNRRYRVEEVRRHEQVVEELLKQGFGENIIVRRVRAPVDPTQPAALGVSQYHAKKIVARVLERWARDDAGKRAQWKSAQIRRLSEMINIARGERAADRTWVRRPDHAAVARYESLLADVQGTREPIQVNVDVRYTEAMMLVIGGMDPGDMSELLAEAKRADDLARRYEQEHPELARTVESVSV